MLGGGLLNLKIAFALLERGIRVTLVVFSPEVLSQLMEPADALLRERRHHYAAVADLIVDASQPVNDILQDLDREYRPDTPEGA